MCGFISELSILFHWSMYLFFCQYHPVLITVTLWFVYLFIYLAAWVLSCGTWVLCCGMRDLSLWHAGSSLWHTGSRARRLGCPAACGILVPQPGIELASPALEGGFLTTGPPGSPNYCNFVVQFEIREYYISSFHLFSQDCFGYSGSFVVPHKF